MLLQQVALEAGGFPNACPNVIRDVSAVRAVFPDESVQSMFIQSDRVGCHMSAKCVGRFCSGLPQSALECRTADGAEAFPIRVSFGWVQVDPTSYASSFISFSVLLQAIAFFSVGALADFGASLRPVCRSPPHLPAGAYRKRLLVFTTLVGTLCTLLAAMDLWWWAGGVFMVISNVAHGAGFVFYNAYLPLLTAAHPDVLAAPPERREEVAKRTEAQLSAFGVAIGHVGAVLLLLVCTGISVAVRGTLAFRITIVLSACWCALYRPGAATVSAG